MSTDDNARPTAGFDTVSVEGFAARGLEPRIITTDDEAAFTQWSQAVARGFLNAEQTPDEVAAARALMGYRRMTGIFDAAAVHPETPVATFASWPDEVSVPGGGTVAAHAITAVTVAPTHRRRGIARLLMEGELRQAAAQRIPIAILTTSESPIYQRYGFGPAAAAATWKLNLTRTQWVGPEPGGRVDFVSRQEWRALASVLHDRARPGAAGEIRMPGDLWDRLAGTRADVSDAASRRAIRYTDESGRVRGAALFTVTRNPDDFAVSRANVLALVAETPAAYAALWRFFVELDLIGELTASELSVEEPLLWMISDQRAATITLRDHLYLRILDLPTALQARRYGAPGRLLLDVTDPLGYAHGRFLLEVDDDGVGTVTGASDTSDEPVADAPVVHLGITELSACYLGGVSLATLALAGRVTTTDAAAASRILGWHRPPRLSFWF